jgi:hypothetical protein
VKSWVTGEIFDFLAGQHDGYDRLPGRPVHERTIVGLKSSFWLVRDAVVGSGQHRIEIAWHFAPGIEWSQGAEHLFETADRTTGVALLPVNNHGWISHLEQEQSSPAYGCKVPSTVLRFSTEAVLPAEFATLILVWSNRQISIGELTTLREEAEGASAYRYRVRGCEHWFMFSMQKQWRVGPWSSDAEFLYFGSDHGQQALAFLNATYVAYAGQRVITCEQLVSQCEIISNGHGLQVLSPTHDRIKLVQWPENLSEELSDFLPRTADNDLVNCDLQDRR